MAQFVGGRYQLIAQLGGGGMADVYLARLTGNDFAKLAVIKRLKPLEDDDPEVIKMFADEARLCARLNHPSIVQTFEVGEDHVGPFLVMEYIEGQPLGRIRSRAGRRSITIPRPIALRILCDTLGALAYAHTLTDHDGTPLRVIHRDVSPENIMVTYAGQTKLVDFGVAKTSVSINQTRAGTLKGKVAYMAPEQARSDVNIDGRADVFAAGLVLWEVLTTRRLWEGQSEARVFERLLDQEPLPRPSTVTPDIPPDLDEICARAMHKETAQRFASATEMLDALEAACIRHDLRASNREIGQFVGDLFEPEREKVRVLVSGSVKKEDAPTEPIDPVPIEESNPIFWRALSGNGIAPPEELAPGAVPTPTPTGAVARTPSLRPEATTTAPMPAVSVPPPSSRPPGSRPSSARPRPISLAPPEDISTSIETSRRLERRQLTQPSIRKQKQAGRRWLTAAVVFFGLTGVTMLAGLRFAPHLFRRPVAVAPSALPATPEKPSEVSVDITVRPSTARIFVDGVAAPSNPHRLRSPKSEASHEIRAEAEGFETRSMVVAFDRDRGLDMVLMKVPPPVTSAPPALTVARTGGGGGSMPRAPGPRAAAPPPASRGIAELEPPKPKATKQEKIDTDVFGR